MPNVMVLPQTRRKSISLSGVCSPRANEPNKYASLTSYGASTRVAAVDMSVVEIMGYLPFNSRTSEGQRRNIVLVAETHMAAR